MRRILLLMAFVASFSGCCSVSENEETIPLTLKVAVNDIYCTDTACSCVHNVAARTYQQTIDRLARVYGIELQFDYFMDSYQLEDAIRSGEYDAVLCKPWFAMRLQQEAAADFQRIVDLLDPDNNRWLTGIVIVPADSPIKSLEELGGKHVYVGEPDGYEKHYAALRLFARNDVEPGTISTNASCLENIGVLLDGLADAAVISDYALCADCAVDITAPDDFRVLAHTEKIPLTSLMLDMNKVDAVSAERLKTALLSISGPNADATLLGEGFVDSSPWNPPELEMTP